MALRERLGHDAGMRRTFPITLAAAALAVAVILTGFFAGLEAVAGEPPAGILDLALDFAESLILVVAMFGTVLVHGRLTEVERNAEDLSARVAEAAAAGSEWRRRSQLLLAGLSEAVERQFADWGLTAAETEVAGLMLKGMSSKEIARARATSEATIRQQAQSVYRKSGLSNRAELAAYFLEDVFDIGHDRLEQHATHPRA
jgi:DNA-binding CsgD family transcriptional regulator